jgi:hypothetical protein
VVQLWPQTSIMVVTAAMLTNDGAFDIKST